MKNQFEQSNKTENTKEDVMKEAREIFGKDFLGPEAIKNALGIELKEIQKIPFSKEDLERAKELNQQLVLYADKAPDGSPLTGEKLLEITGNRTSDNESLFECIGHSKGEDFFAKETPRSGWKLVSKEVIQNSTGDKLLNFERIERAEAVISYLKDKVFAGRDIPEEYKKAIEEFETKKAGFKKIVPIFGAGEEVYSFSDKELEELDNLQILKLTMETLVEVVYRLTLNERINKERLLENHHIITSSKLSDGTMVSAGSFNSNGITIYTTGRVGSTMGLAVCLSYQSH